MSDRAQVQARAYEREQKKIWPNNSMQFIIFNY